MLKWVLVSWVFPLSREMAVLGEHIFRLAFLI